MTRGGRGAAVLAGLWWLASALPTAARAPDGHDTLTVTTREDVASAWQTPAGGATLSVTTPPAHGVIERDGPRWRYRPTQDWFGDDTATLQRCTAPEACRPTTVTLRVTPVNDPPALTPVTLVTRQDVPSAPTPLVITDPDASQPPTLDIIASERGTATLDQDRLIFTPAYGVTGTASVALMLCDDAGACVDATVPVRITNVNDAPRISVTPLEIAEDAGPTPLTVTVRDPDPADTYALAVTLPPAQGQAAITTDGQRLTYTPAADYHGEDAFFVAACDAAQACADARVTVTVQPVNDPPTRLRLALVTKQGRASPYVTPVVEDVDDADGHQLTVLVPPAGVDLEFDAARTALRVLPQPDFSGTTTFLLQACDAAGGCVVTDASIDVIPTQVLTPDDGALRVDLVRIAADEPAVDVLRTDPLPLFAAPSGTRLTGVVQVDAQLDAAAPVAYRLGDITLRPGETRLIAYVDVDAHAGRLELPIAPLAGGPLPAGAGGELRLRLSEPHTPDVRVPLTLWDPVAAIGVQPATLGAPPAGETVVARALSGDPRCRDGVRVVREPLDPPTPGPAGRYCAVHWLDLPAGVRQDPNSALAQLVSDPSAAPPAGPIRYQPGVIVFAADDGPGRFRPGLAAREFTLPPPPTPAADDPAPVAVTLQAARHQGAVPFLVDLQVVLDRPAQAALVGAVRWEWSEDDGATWTPLPAAATPAPGWRYATTLTTPGTRQYRVTTVNRVSGATRVAPPLTLRTFRVPTFELLGFEDTYLGRTSTWRMASDHPEPLVYRWRLEAPGAAPVEREGTVIPLRAKRLGEMTLTVAARLAAAPDVPEAWRTVRRQVQVTLPPLRRPRIEGPARVRAGERATFVAHTGMVLDTTGEAGWRLGGQWRLPNGTTVAGPRVDYLPAAGDGPLHYDYWLEGHDPATRASVSVTPTVWAYRWPAWRLFTQTLRPYAPARVYYEAKADPPETLGAEPVTYRWAVPPGGVIEERTDAGVVVRYDQPGSYELRVAVSDTQGHATEVGHVFDTLPPEPLAIALTLTTADTWQRVPETVTATWTVTGLTETEVIEHLTLTVDDQDHQVSSRTGARFTLATAGEHRIRVALRTNYGRAAEDLRALVLTAGIPPRCEISSVQPAGQPRLLHAHCTAAEGVLREYRWVIRYAGGREQALTTRGTALRLSRQAMQQGVAAVSLVAVTDKDLTSAPVHWAPP